MKRSNLNNHTLLECSSLDYSIGYKKILKKISFSIHKNEIVALAGDNGSGKSTLLKLLLKKNSNIVWHLEEMGQNRYPVSYLGHEAGLYSSLTLMENMNYFAGISGAKFLPERMEKLLHVFHLESRLYDPVYTFSRGMLQKTAIIRTLAMDAALYLLDEPYTGLDERSVTLLNEEIALLKQNSSVMLVVHSSELIKKITDRTITLVSGVVQT